MQLHKISRRTNNVVHVMFFFSFFFLHIIFFWARSDWLLSCCDVPANVYILIVMFFLLLLLLLFSFFWYHKGKANKIKNKFLRVLISNYAELKLVAAITIKKVLSQQYDVISCIAVGYNKLMESNSLILF